MRQEAQNSIKVKQDNYGRWFVEVRAAGRKHAPIRCLTEQEARNLADRMHGILTQECAA